MFTRCFLTAVDILSVVLVLDHKLKGVTTVQCKLYRTVMYFMSSKIRVWCIAYCSALFVLPNRYTIFFFILDKNLRICCAITVNNNRKNVERRRFRVRDI